MLKREPYKVPCPHCLKHQAVEKGIRPRQGMFFLLAGCDQCGESSIWLLESVGTKVGGVWLLRNLHDVQAKMKLVKPSKK